MGEEEEVRETLEPVATVATGTEKQIKEAKRPKKRRKVPDGDDLVLQTEDIEQDISLPDQELQATLPSFPLPALPKPPSKSDLAFQGLDQALVDAEIVNPTTLSRIPSDGEDEVK